MIGQAPTGIEDLRTDAILIAEPSPEERSAKPEGDELRALIAERAYFIAQRRGFEAGHDVEDWLQAEAEILDDFTQPVR